MKHSVPFFFDHIPGLPSEAIYPFRNATSPPMPGWTRYAVTVQFDDGAASVESVCVDVVAKPAGVVLTVDGSAKYEFSDK